MAENAKLQIVIDAEDKASPEIKKFNGSLEKTQGTLKSFITGAAGLIAATMSVNALKNGFMAAIDASNQMNDSMVGLSSIARAFGQNIDAATMAAKELSADGLMSVKDAASGLKSLLATGLSLDQSIKLMNGLKDAAAFNRQGMLSFGAAIEGATQGLKNGNSVMVDNAGVTKNLSNILVEAGYSAQDLGKVSTDLAVRTALYNEILKETAVFQGDAARLSETLSGQQAKLSTSFFNLKVAIGDELKPVMLFFVGLAATLIEEVQEMTAVVNEAGGLIQFLKDKLVGFMTLLEEKTGLVTILRHSFENIVLVFKNQLLPELQKLWEALKPLLPFLEALAKVVGFTLYAAFVAMIKIIETGLLGVMQLLTISVQVLTKFVDGLVWAWEKVSDVFTKVSAKIDEVISKMKSLSNIGGIGNAISGFLGFGGARAEGGPVKTGSAYLVGERGPEMFVPSGNGSIVPNNKMGGGGTTINIVVNGDVTGEDLIDRVGSALIQQLKLSSAAV